MMYHPNLGSCARAHQRRKGLVLLVVLSMLALFASVAISFVFYAESAAEAARQNRLAQIINQPEIDPEVLAAFFLNQLIYDTDNIYSSMRGWSLARSMYGYNPNGMNYIPYNGVGRSALSYPEPDLMGLDNFNYLNYQTFYNPFAAAADKTVNFVRTPEYTDKVFFGPGAQPPSPSQNVAGAPTYRFVGGANPPWTSFDTNSLFLAEMTADGRVLMPSFARPWTGAALAGLTAPQQDIVRKYMSLRPDKAWHPGFAGNLPDQDANGDVKNLDWGPGGNDSIWIDIGAPVMTAPDGRRYKPLYAVLITDLASKLHLFAHGNNLGGTAAVPPGNSNLGLGAPEVNLNALIGMTITSAQQIPFTPPPPPVVPPAVRRVVTTALPHGLVAGQQVMISGVADNRYNGTFATLAGTGGTIIVYARVAGALPPSTGGFAYDPAKLAEMQRLFGLRYFGPTLGTAGGNAIGSSQPIPAGTFATLTDGDGSDGSGFSTKAYLSGFRTALTQAVPPAGLPAARTVTVAALSGSSANSLPWGIEVNMRVNIDVGANAETVNITAVNFQTGTITATFTKPHVVGAAIVFNSYFGFPAFPPSGGWNNGVGETNNVPLAYDAFRPNLPNILPIPMSNQESLLRFNGTNGPALTSEIFRRMPSTFNDIRARNMVTLNNWSLDRIGASPFLTLDRTGPAVQYAYNPALRYPVGAPFPPPNFLVPGSVTPTGPPAWNNEFSNDWRSNLGNLMRLDLNRPLTDYPIAPNSQSRFTAAQIPQVNQAVADRQLLASDIYKALVRITGTRDPNIVPGMGINNADYQAARWLAQLAVNMVDYIDNDDYLTPFNWNATGAAASGGAIPSEWLFGTEIPRLVVNEAYAQHDTLPGARLTVWTELQNPLLSRNAAAWNAATAYAPGTQVTSNGNLYLCTAANTNQVPPNPLYWQLQYPLDNGAARLQMIAAGVGAPAYPVYKVVVCGSTLALTKAMRDDPANNLGDPEFNVPPGSRIITDNTSVPNPWGTVVNGTQRVLPANGGFNVPVVAKQISPPDANPNLTGARQPPPMPPPVPANTVRIATTTPHGFQVGHAVTITGVTNMGGVLQAGFEGTYVITRIVDTTHFEYLSPTAGLGTQNGGGFATYAGTAAVPGNTGFYVLGPANARYPDPVAGRHPILPATYASPAMAVPNAPIGIPPGSASQNAMTNVVTIAVPNNFAVGDVVRVWGMADPNYNGNPITVTAANAGSFSYAGPAGLTSPSGGGNVILANVSVVLRRLANPHLPPQLVPGPNYNPYVTVDYIDGLPVAPDTAGPAGFSSFGRRQPYTANQNVLQTNPINGARPNNSFFQQNDGATTPFTWLVHLDRRPVNPLEMIHVSGFRPHELTQQFNGNFGHYAQQNPFAPGQAYATNQGSLLYRSLDLMGTRYQAGLYAGGRVPGRININTMTELEIFLALCDPHAGPTSRYPNAWFTQADVQNILTKLIVSRTGNPAANYAPVGLPLATSDTFPQGTQRPFKSFAAGDINDTVLRPDPTNAAQPLFTVGAPGTHPYARAALLQKILNNITTTSDSFAVWCTVGYFEVLDESVRPVRLGNEVGRSENRHIRHRFFSIVDRTGLQLFNTSVAGNGAVSGTTLSWIPTQAYAIGNTVMFNNINYQCIQPNAGQSPANAAFWAPVIMKLNGLQTANGTNMINGGAMAPALQVGMMVEIDAGTANAEVVVVQNVNVNGNPLWFTAAFTKNHAAGAPVFCRGNPGPWTNYNPRRDTNVVLHMSVIN